MVLQSRSTSTRPERVHLSTESALGLMVYSYWVCWIPEGYSSRCPWRGNLERKKETIFRRSPHARHRHCEAAKAAKR